MFISISVPAVMEKLQMKLETLLGGLRAAGEETRLRILTALARCELTVTELTTVLVQSQPRVSRHLKLLHEAGLIARFHEGAWVFYRLAARSDAAELARLLLARLDTDDTTIARDRVRLDEVRTERAERAARYFSENAERWHSIRSHYVAESSVEQALLETAGDGPFDSMLDVGTGTGRLLELFAPRVGSGVGLDLSHEMLALARTALDRAGIRHCQVRHGDLYNLPVTDQSVDLVTVHQVLHYLDRPEAAVAEAARVLAPGGRLLIADFAPHQAEALREAHAHRRLGFADAEVGGWCRAAGLSCARARLLAGDRDSTLLTVSIWTARRPRGAGRNEPATARRRRPHSEEVTA